MITIDVHICDQRRSYLAHFAKAEQFLHFALRQSLADHAAGHTYGNHAYSEVHDEFPLIPPVGPVNWDTLLVLDYLYPQCEHGLSADLCSGPNHYPTYEQERMEAGY